MKIGILTLPLHTNYGGILQAYALYSTLKEMGHDVTLIDGKMYQVSTVREKTSVAVWQVMYHLGFRPTIHPQLIVQNEMESIIPFIETHIPQQISLDKVKSNTFEAIIVGSDQVWRGDYCSLFPFFLDSAEGWNIRRIAYAISFGKDEWHQNSNVLTKCRHLIKAFDFVSVREKSGINICREQLQCDAEWVIDPTMLKTAEEYKKLLPKASNPSKRYLVSYILDKNTYSQGIVFETAKKRNLDIKEMKLPANGEKAISVEEWLKTLLNAEFVITDSFHCTVFSLLFNRPFVVLENYERGNSRLISLLGVLGVSNRIAHNMTESASIEEYPIVWRDVNHEMTKQREKFINVIYRLLS